MTRRSSILSRFSGPLRWVWHLYADGFRSMTDIGRGLWLLILVKLAILFLVFKLFLFPDVLKRDYDNDAERAQAVRSSLAGHDGRLTPETQP